MRPLRARIGLTNLASTAAARWVVTVAIVPIGTLLPSGLASQDVEEFLVASGEPEFAEEPWIQGNVVVWQRYPDRIQCRDIGRGDSPVVDVARFPANRVGVTLSPSHLYWGGDGSPVLARRTEDLSLGLSGPNIRVAELMTVLAASPQHVFLKDTGGEAEGMRILAKPVSRLADPLPDAFGVVASVRSLPNYQRSVAVASEDYFVWQDRGSEGPTDHFKVYAKRTVDLLVPGTEWVALDADSADGSGQLGLHGGILVVSQAIGEPQVLWMVDLDARRGPLPVAHTWQSGVLLRGCDVSSEYAVWTESRYVGGLLDRTAFAIRMDQGTPLGTCFRIGSDGSFLQIDGNIAVWTVGSDPVFRTAVMAAELPLPGAEDVGDVDQNGRVDIADAVIILDYLFRGGWKPRKRLADTDGNGTIQITDSVRILGDLFAWQVLRG